MKELCGKLLNRTEKLAIVGMGYVGMPIAVCFAKRVDVIGFDINSAKIKAYKSGIDPTTEVGDEEIKNSTVVFTDEPKMLKQARFIIVAVPTPVKDDNTPDLFPIESSCVTVGKNLQKGSIVVFESTVYPGVTEEVCVPILERESGLKCGPDFKVGYSPERINPGDHVHRLDNIVKIVSGMDVETLEAVADIYEIVVKAGVHKAESIKVAEMTKVIENTQRDVNIAFMNELSMICNKLKIDTKAVLEAGMTKWNFLKFFPGLVGGHCIGVDPYYIIHRAEEAGFKTQLISAARRVNDGMAKYIAENIVKKIIKSGVAVQQARVGVLGFTFKENCPDVRNTKVYDIVAELEDYGIKTLIFDNIADKDEVKEHYGIELVNAEDMRDLDVVVVAVGHRRYRNYKTGDFHKYFKKDAKKRIIIDVKGIYNRNDMLETGFDYWRL